MAKHILAFALLSVFVATPAHAARVLILGDSLGASYGIAEQSGWVALLQEKLPEHEFTNGSVSGETTAGGLRRLPALLDSVAPDLVVVELGGNDGLRGFPPTQLEKNLIQIITLAKDSGAKVLLTEIMVPPNYGPRYTQKFTQVYQDISKAQDIMLIPFFMQDIAPYPELMQRDGIHPNEKAQAKIANWMQPWIEKALTQ
ncbi:arylesterase [Shewanella sp. KJ2020]|uniref:arylesterase n=1 Tax=Shewanella sp. KJ2020 TaxID=2919172 RepID=UPI0020A71758|nr:arylesterase [Shewanella sp. KJ2020]MCP3127508.1 arylesterase [Shewanella sp. KJ2020]